MADLALDQRFALPAVRSVALAWLFARREVVALVALMAVAAALRLWDLDAKALHHDESLHATFSWYLYHGDGYRHDPLMHGPFQFQINALTFFLFGASDYTARLPHALFGTALVGMPYLLRRQLGLKAVFIAATLITFSPTLLYFSRFDREDIYTVVWTFAIVICIWRYLDEQKPGWLYAMAAALALSFATKEVTFITVAILLVFLDLVVAVDLGRRREGEGGSPGRVFGRTLAFVPVAWLIAAGWPLLGRRPFGLERLSPAADVLVVLGSLALPQFAAGIQVLPFVGDKGYRAPAEETLTVTTVLVCLITSAYAGLLWRPKVWLIAAASFYAPYVLLYTTFFTNQPAIWTGDFWRGHGGFWSGIWGSLDYWLGQHDVKRGNQPVYYYGLLTPLYEFLPLLLALGGAAWLLLRGDYLRRWLLFWLGGIFIGLSLAGEKMPWLESNIALPLALAGGVSLAAAIDGLGVIGRRWLNAGAAAVVSGAAVLLLVEAGSADALRLAGWALGAGLLGWTAASLRTRGVAAFARASLTVAVAALLTLTARAGITVSFANYDTPVEMLVYTQTSPEIPTLRARIDALAKASGLGRNLPIVIDPTDGFAWPWAWYLRDYHDFSYTNPASPNSKPKEGAVLLVSRANAANLSPAGYTVTPYKHRWWFCESYRDRAGSCRTDGGLKVSDFVAILTSGDKLRSLGHFFLYRRPAATSTGAVDAVAYFPESLAAFDVQRQAPKSAPAPVSLDDGRIVIGRAGVGQGELSQPAGLFVDGDGNIWVADSGNNRIQKFDFAGNFLAVLSGGSAALNEPWSVAVDREGFVYVADTWNHRLRKYSPSFELLKTWGEPGARQNPGPFDLYGPRDIVLAEDGTLWVSDTGNKRLLHYSSEGEPRGEFGSGGPGPGQFDEPVGLAFDARGRLYVADVWNARIQRFDAGFTAAAAFPTGWSSLDIVAKPYLAVLSDGRILASDPGKGLLLLLDADGRPLGLWRPDADAQPLGVAAIPDGGFVFSDARRGQVQIVPGPLIDRLFR